MTMELLELVEVKLAILYVARRSAFADQSFVAVHLVDDDGEISDL